jgi:hypothetical protein
MTFVKRTLGFTFQLGTGSFGGSGSNTITTPDGLWANVNIKKNGVPSMNEAEIAIYGLSLSVMNQLSRIGLLPTAVRNNVVTVMAGEEGGTPSLAFAGGIKESWPDFSSSTEAVLRVSARTGLLAQMKPVAPSSYSGSTDVATVMGQLAKTMGYTLENNGVSSQVRDPYLPGTARAQALALADAAGIYVVFEDDNGVMAILPKTGARATAAPTISPLEDMKGYPTYVGPGQVGLECEYNKQLRFLGNIIVQDSLVGGANGTWRVTGLEHELSTLPDGPWFSKIRGNNLYSATSQ